jgi:hypothetical protein
MPVTAGRFDVSGCMGAYGRLHDGVVHVLGILGLAWLLVTVLRV